MDNNYYDYQDELNEGSYPYETASTSYNDAVNDVVPLYDSASLSTDYLTGYNTQEDNGPYSGGAKGGNTEYAYGIRMLEILNQRVGSRKDLPPLMVIMLLIFCFPIGVVVLFAGTRWGAFAKIFLTLLMLAAFLLIYEVLVAKGAVSSPSLFAQIASLFR